MGRGVEGMGGLVVGRGVEGMGGVVVRGEGGDGRCGSERGGRGWEVW